MHKKLLLRAAELIELGWTRGTAARDIEGQKVRSTAPQATAWCVKVATISSWRTGLVVSYVRSAHLSAPRVTSAVKRPLPSAVTTSRPRA
jgi:hypothetical protein